MIINYLNMIFRKCLESEEVYIGFWGEGKPVGKRPLCRPRHRREDNIKLDLQKVGIRWHGLN